MLHLLLAVDRLVTPTPAVWYCLVWVAAPTRQIFRHSPALGNSLGAHVPCAGGGLAVLPLKRLSIGRREVLCVFEPASAPGPQPYAWFARFSGRFLPQAFRASGDFFGVPTLHAWTVYLLSSALVSRADWPPEPRHRSEVYPSQVSFLPLYFGPWHRSLSRLTNPLSAVCLFTLAEN